MPNKVAESGVLWFIVLLVLGWSIVDLFYTVGIYSIIRGSSPRLNRGAAGGGSSDEGDHQHQLRYHSDQSMYVITVLFVASGGETIG